MEEQYIRPTEDELIAQEEKCRKSMRPVAKAVFMRIFVMALLVWAMIQATMELWIVGIVVFVMLITLAGMLPLIREWNKQRKKLKEILDQYE